MKAALCILILVGTAQAREHDREAKRLTREAIAHYQSGRYSEAIDGFQAAWARVHEPELLYNIAQAYRRRGECEQARKFYKEYLDAQPAAFNRGRVEERIGEMQQCTPRETAEPPPWMPPPDRPRGVEKPAPPPRPPRGRVAMRAIGILSIGAGLALVGTGGWQATHAAASADRISMLYQSGGQWSADWADEELRGQEAQTAATAMLSVGGVALAAGVTLIGFGWSAR